MMGRVHLWLTFADILPPDIGEGASSTAVDTFGLIGTNDHIGQARSGFENEDSSVFTLFLLPSTRTTYWPSVSIISTYNMYCTYCYPYGHI
jgi:hypothetical protein